MTLENLPDLINGDDALVRRGRFFSGRFVVQWVSSERRKRSVVPELFWWLSLGGALCLLVYAILRRDIVILAGQLGGLVVYSRNLVLLRRAAARGGPR